ncbi:type II toxin-antitoxin system RelE/ParE family toxin [Dickeya sp. NCPPB 3274]|uniref:type II toxin-antitoxin system RelE/ParE family toxin n=1 Tax=Dickeya sp. NCPPB 3274 TaxID=568766 RepID=UPI00039DF305|nr:type II toxin-antitoxin system RelE/ParE family toxin [Dickeya sp. NCPPB 3274]
MTVMIQYTRTVKVCLEDITNHLRRIEAEPKEVISGIIEHFENRVSDFPLGCQVCPELLKIGCAKYRECNTPDGYRVLYSVEDDVITAHAILAHKQDIQNLLFKRLISI